MPQTNVGQNVAYELNGKELVIHVDLAAPGQKSASGKTTVIASTRGNVQVADNVFLGLNVYRK